ncbi:MAG: bifunctional 5,10-methylenetetrahydrofolate dehydrogenase/5,10-methenyltetrahydrofolate cyclohydrolase [Patescibacteria group bacterium]
MRILDGTELADYVKERQAKQVRNLRQAAGIAPKLAIIQTVDDPVIDMYVRMKRRYGQDILVDVDIHRPTSADEVTATIQSLNQDSSVHGIIVQLPLAQGIDIDTVLSSVSVEKDVDGLAAQSSRFTAATAQAIDWLLNGYNVELRGKKIAIVGNGRLVGAPLAKLWKDAGHQVIVFDEHSGNIAKTLRRYPIIVSAAGVPGLIRSDSLQVGAVIVDAATSAEHGRVVGDIATEVRDRTDLTITPEKGGVGPLTVVSLFDNVIRAARAAAESKD